MSTLELLDLCEVADKIAEHNFLVELTPKQFKRVKIKFASMPGRIWKCETFAAVSKDGENTDSKTAFICFTAIYSSRIHEKTIAERKCLVIHLDSLIGEECRWINKSCYRFTFRCESKKNVRADFFHDKTGKVRLIHTF